MHPLLWEKLLRNWIFHIETVVAQRIIPVAVNFFIMAIVTIVIKMIIFAGIYLLKVNDENTWKRSESVKVNNKETAEQCNQRHSYIYTYNVNFRQFLHCIWVFLLLTLNG